ncbi:MAG: site-specific DNA-methyltransferase, partial [Chloroflexi bacterium]|nr:site-specific DNA-methyltransferase [Chloroflexota bacterium]
GAIAAMENDRVLDGDCLAQLRTIPDASVHMVITSPPYNLGVSYDAYDDRLSRDEYRAWLMQVWAEVKRVLVSGGRFALNVAPTSIKNFHPIHYDLASDLMRLGFIMRTEILWYKQTIYRRTAWGSWKSARNPHVMPSWEYVLVFCKDKWELDGNARDADITREEFIRFSDGFWYIPPETRRNGHPAPFPEELIRRLIKFYTFRGNVVLDPFGGTGTVALVARQTGRHFIHIDHSREYNQIARERIATAHVESLGKDDTRGEAGAAAAARVEPSMPASLRDEIAQARAKRKRRL